MFASVELHKEVRVLSLQPAVNKEGTMASDILIEGNVVEEQRIALDRDTIKTEPLWTVSEVASYLRLKPETIRLMARNGELPSIKVGRRVWRFKISEVKDWLKASMEGR